MEAKVIISEERKKELKQKFLDAFVVAINKPLKWRVIVNTTVKDTDPQTISYEIFDASVASDDPEDDNYPCGRSVYETGVYYNPDC